jgi:hypothetical protein
MPTVNCNQTGGTHLSMHEIHALLSSSPTDFRMTMPYTEQIRHCALVRKKSNPLTKVCNADSACKVEVLLAVVCVDERALSLGDHRIRESTETVAGVLLAKRGERGRRHCAVQTQGGVKRAGERKECLDKPERTSFVQVPGMRGARGEQAPNGFLGNSECGSHGG